MTLQRPVALVGPEDMSPVHFIAVGGASMHSIARLYADRGLEVSGCDQAPGTLDQLAGSGIVVSVGHSPDHLDGVRSVVVSSAIRETNPELLAARERGIPVWHRSAALAALMGDDRVVSVAGTHGKTTTTAMIATILESAGQDPSYAIGAPLASTQRSAHVGDGGVFVVEADESDGSFLQYPTEIAVITNVEADHLDNWGTPAAYAAGFREFARQEQVRCVVVSHDDPGGFDLAAALRETDAPQEVLTYGEQDGADVRLVDVSFDAMVSKAVLECAEGRFDLVLQVPGRHNLHDAAAAFAVALRLGVSPQAALAGLASFSGTLRRFQPVAEVGGVRIYDDYAHHPTELRAALSAARKVAGDGRVVACFQPHLYSRTLEFATEFARALELADVVVVTDIYGSREDPIPGVTSRLIVNAADPDHGFRLVPHKGDLPAALADLVHPGDLVLTLGAGDVTLVGPLLASELTARGGATA